MASLRLKSESETSDINRFEYLSTESDKIVTRLMFFKWAIMSIIDFMHQSFIKFDSLFQNKNEEEIFEEIDILNQWIKSKFFNNSDQSSDSESN